MTLAEYIRHRFAELKEERLPYENGLWKDIARFVNPRRENISQTSFDVLKGRRKGKDVYDGTPLGALNTWSDGMQGFLVSEALTWFRSEMGDARLNEYDEVLEWLQWYDKVMYSAFRRSNFYSVLPEWFRDAGSVGTATLYTEEDTSERRAVCTVIHPREVFIAENYFGEVDTIYRYFALTARRALKKFSEGKLSKELSRNAREHPEKAHYFIHAVFPNDDKLPDNLHSTRKRFRSVYVEEAGDVVRDGGYNINPYAVWRFRKNSDEVYGYSPAADAIVEIFSLNQFGKTLIQAAQKSVEPPLNVPMEMRNNVRLTPNGLNYYEDPQRIIKAAYTGINYPVGTDQLERLKKSIEDKYRVEFFLLLARATREMTAYEIMERQSEKSVLLSSQVDQLYNEGIKRVFDIISDIEDKLGNFRELPPVPEMLRNAGARININLTGPLAQAQKRLFKMQPINDGLNSLAPAMTIFPEMKYKVKTFETADEILEAANFPESLTRNNDEALELYQQALQQAAQQNQFEQLGQAAQAVPKLSKSIEPNSALEKIMENV